MKTKNLLIALAMTAAMTACGNDENDNTVDVDLNKPVDMSFSIGQTHAQQVDTRATASTTTSTFESGDLINVTLVTATGATGTVAIDAANASYRENGIHTYGTGFAGKFYWQNTGDTHSFYAYYPSQADFPKATDGSYSYTHPVSLPTAGTPLYIDYTTGEKLNQGNFMYGTVNSTATNSSISLALTHCMSQITFTIAQGAGYESVPLPDFTKVEILNGSGLMTAGTFNLSQGTVVGTAVSTGAPTSIRPLKSDDTWYAVVFPGQTFAKGTDFIRFTTADATTYTYTLGSNDADAITCEPNKSYNFALQLDKREVTLGSFTVSQWSPVDKSGSAGMDIED